MAELKFGIYGDSTSFKKALEDATKGVTQAKTKIESEGKSMSSVFDSLKKAATGLGVAFGLNELKNLGVQIAKTRSDFQQLEVSFKTMLGSGEKANAMLKQLTTTAATTPFGLQEVAGGAKQLLAYGIEAEKVNDMLIRLGDIASGLSIPLNDLVYLYGTTMTQGRMFTQDLRQFQGRGIPIADELAKQFGIAKSQVGEFVTAGKVGAKEVEQAIINMTSAGSQFGGLMKAQSETIGGRWSNIEDQIDMAFNEIGQNSEGFINGFLDSINYLIENYKTIGTYLGGIIASYGVWKATLLAHNAISKTMADGEVANLTKIAKANLDALKAKEQRLNLEMEEADKNNDVDKYVDLGTQKEALAKQIETAEEQLNTLAKTQNTTATQANAVATTTNATTTKASTIATKSNTLAVKAQNLAYGLGVKALGLFKGAWNALKTAFMSNPIGMIAVGITSVITLISAWRGKQDEMNKSLEEGKEKAKSYFDALKQEGGTIKSYVSTIRDKNANDLEQIKAYRELMKLVPEITNQYTQQELAALNATKAEELLTEAINNREIAKSKQDIATAQSTLKALEGGASWEELQASERKFLQDTMAFDKESVDDNVSKVKKAIEGFIPSAKNARNNLVELNKVADLKNMKSGEEKIKALSKEMANLGQKKELIDNFSKTLTAYGENIGTIGASMPLEKLQKDLIPKIKEQFGIDFNLYDLIEHNWSGGIDESGTQSKIKQFLETYFGGIAEEIKANYKMLDDEINKESGIGIEVNPYLNMNETQLNESLEKIEGDINDKLRIIQQNEELEKIVILNADIQDAKAQEAYNTALAQLDANAKALGQDRYVSSNVEFNAVVTPRFVLGNTQNETPFPTQDLLNRPFNQWLPTGNINTSTNQELQIMVQTQQQEIQKLKEQLNSKKTTSTTPTTTKKSGGGKGKSQKELDAEYKEAQNKRAEVEKQIGEERVQDALEIENEITQATIDAKLEGSEKILAQMAHDRKLQQEELQKRKDDAIQAEKDRQKELFEAQEVEKVKEASAHKKKYTATPWDDSMLDQSKIDAIIAQFKKLEDIQLDKLFKEQASSIDEYLKQFGTLQQSIEATTRLFDKKIKEASTESERLSLMQEKEQTISGLRSDALLKNIDLASVFNDFGIILKTPLQATLDELKKYTTTDAFKKRDISEQKQIYDAIAKAEQGANGIGALNYKGVGEAVANYNLALSQRVELEQRLYEAEEKMRLAYEAMIKLGKDANPQDIENARLAYEQSKVGYNQVLNDYNQANQNVAQTQSKANTELNKFNDTLNQVDDVVRGLYNGSLKSIWELLGKKFQKRIGLVLAGTYDISAQYGELNEVLTKGGMTIDSFAEKIADGLTKLSDGNISGQVDNVISEAFKSLGVDIDFSNLSETLSTELTNNISSALNAGQSIADVAQNTGALVSDVIKKVGDVASSSGDMWGMIIGLILSLLDEFAKNGLGEFVSTLVKNVGDAVSGILGNLLHEAIPMILESIVVLIGDVFEGLLNLFSFGAFGTFNELFGGTDLEKLTEQLDDLTASNDALRHSVDELKTQIENSSFLDATNAYLEARNDLTKSEANTLKQMNLAGKAYDAGFAGIGGEHSSFYEINEGMEKEDWKTISNIVGKTITDASTFFSLSSEQMHEVATRAPELYAKIKKLGKEGYSDVSMFMDDYIELWKELEDLEEQYINKLTQTSFDDLKNSFADAISDMEMNASDFSLSFEELMAKAIKESIMSGEIANRLKEWQKKMAGAMESDGLDIEEIVALRGEYIDMYEDANFAYEQALKSVGIDMDKLASSSTSANRGIESMTQQEAEELNGRFTALQIAGEGIRQQSAQTNALLMALTSQITPCIATSAESSNTLYELRELAITRNAYLSDISDYTKNLVAIKKTLSNIETNTQNL